MADTSFVETVIERKLLWRALIDNACSNEANLSDAELVTFLMTLEGRTETEIARVLDPDKKLSRTRIWQHKKSSFDKVMCISALSHESISFRNIKAKKGNTMPKGVYDRSKAKPRQPKNGNGTRPKSLPAAPVQDKNPLDALFVEETPARRPVIALKRVYQVAAADMPFEHPLYDIFREMRMRLENTTSDWALCFVFDPLPADDLTLLLTSLRELVTERLGERAIEIAAELAPDDGSTLLYVRRGPAWKSREHAAYRVTDFDSSEDD